MNCQNCKHWVEGYCMVTGSLVDKDVLCNAWELSLSWEQVAETPPATGNTASKSIFDFIWSTLSSTSWELQERIAKLESDLSNKITEYTDLWDDALEFQECITYLEAERDSYRERCKELESRLDLYYGNAYDVVVDENAKLIARVAKLERRITEAKALLEVEMGEWGATENFYLPDHFLQLRKALDVLDGGGE